MTDSYTEDITKFGSRERAMLGDLLKATENGFPEGFNDQGVKPAMNMNSGYVFLVNEDFQVCMMNGDKAEVFHSLPYGGLEGFLTDLLEEHSPDDLNEDDIDYILQASETESVELSGDWLKIQEYDEDE